MTKINKKLRLDCPSAAATDKLRLDVERIDMLDDERRRGRCGTMVELE